MMSVLRIRALLFLISVGIFSFPIQPPLHADTIYLKNGKSFKGFMESISGERMIFSGPDGKIEISPSEVLKIEIDYSGIPVCFTGNGDGEKRNCDGLLQSLGEDGAVIFFSKEKRITIPLNKISKMEFSKISKRQKIIPILSLNLMVSLKMYDGSVFAGKVAARDKSGKSIFLESEDGNWILIQEENVVEGSLLDRWDPYGFYWYSLVPGVHQYFRREYLKSGLIVGGLITMGGGLFHEYVAAKQMNGLANADIFFLFFGMNQGEYARKFRAHQNGQRAFGVGMALIYAYHLIDAYGTNKLFRGSTGNPISLQINLNQPDPRREIPVLGNAEGSVSLELVYRY